MADTEYGQLVKMGNSRNPIQQSRFQELQNSGQTALTTDQSPSSSGFSTGVSDPVATAQKIQQFTVQANQPAISTLQGQIAPLQQRYTDLLNSIKGVGTVASNFAQQSASMDLGRRGLLPQSQEGQQALSNALLPVTAQTQGQLSSAGLAQQQDINQINNAIAALQTGNPAQAITSAIGQYQSQLANQYQQLGPYGIYNAASGETINPNTVNIQPLGNTSTQTTSTPTTSTSNTPLSQVVQAPNLGNYYTQPSAPSSPAPLNAFQSYLYMNKVLGL